MKRNLLFLLILSPILAISQITIEPEEWLPCEEIKLIIDISVGTCDLLQGSDGPLYMWAWGPGDPIAGNGEWTDSNEAMQLTQEGPDLWSITLVPTEFFQNPDTKENVTADEVYANGFSLLVKADNAGTDGGCDELKTDDYQLDVAPPFRSEKVFALPSAVFSDDVFNFYYDNTLETKESMQNLDEVYVYAAAIANGVEYPIETMENVGSNPNLMLDDAGDGKFVLSVIPDEFFSVPENEEIEQLLFIVRKKDMSSDDDRADEDAIFDLGCEAAAGGC